MVAGDSHCQRQAADDDPGGGRGDCRSPDATGKPDTIGKEAGASLRLAEGQYFPWLTWSLALGGSLVGSWAQEQDARLPGRS